MSSLSTWPWTLKALFWIALIWSCKIAQPLLAPIAVAVVLAMLLTPGVRALRRHGVPSAAGAAAMIGTLVLALALLATALARPAAEWWDRAPGIVARLVVQLERARAALPLSPAAASPEAAAAKRVAGPADAAVSPANPRGHNAVTETLVIGGVGLSGELAARVVSFMISAGATLILLFFLLVSEHWIVARIVEAIAARRTRAIVLSGVRSAQRDIGRFLGTLGLIYIGVGVVTAAAMSWIGLPGPLLWGVVCTVLNFIPYLGPLVTAALLFVAALVSFEPGVIVFAPPLAFLLIHFVESNFVSPWFVAQRLVLSPIAVFLAVLFWGWMWGVTGAVIAVPMLVGLRSACRHTRGLVLLRH